MAPRRGGGSSSSSGSGSSGGGSSCEYCNEPLELSGNEWKDRKTNAYFAIEIIVLVLLFACLALALRFKWARQHGADKLRTAGYTFATVCTIIFYLFAVVDIGLHEADTTTTYLYYLTYIFSSLFWRLSELIILAIILRTICESSTSGKLRSLNPVNIIAVVLLAILCAAAYGIYVAETAKTISDGFESRYYSDDYEELLKDQYHVSVAYQALYLVVAIFAGLVGLFSMVKERSKQTLIMAVFVLPALFLRSLLGLVAYAMYDAAFSRNQNSSFDKTLKNINWANNFIYDLMTGAIFVGVAIIGGLRPTNARVLQQKGYGNAPPLPEAYGSQPAGYVSAGYGNALAGYGNNAHVVH